LDLGLLDPGFWFLGSWFLVSWILVLVSYLFFIAISNNSYYLQPASRVPSVGRQPSNATVAK
jgi:hypothetical protein